MIAFRFLAYMQLMVIMLCSSCRWDSNTQQSPKFVIVNVLDKESYDDCHIKGSIHVPFIDLKQYALDHWNKDSTEIIVHCSNYFCGASSEGYKLLTQAGFKHVWAFEGGTAEAKQFGIPVVGTCAQSYLQNYEKPEGYKEKENIAVISVKNLKKKMEEFALPS